VERFEETIVKVLEEEIKNKGE
jgi:hypothetical protein